MTGWFELNTLSDISRDIAQVFFASMFINEALTKEFNATIITAGFLLSVIFWLFSLRLKYKLNK